MSLVLRLLSRFLFLAFAVCAQLCILTKAQAFDFSVISFNTWGVPFAVQDTGRYAQAMQAIANLTPDFVFLEEVFSFRGQADFKNALYPYAADGPGALPKLVSSGLRILSRYPIVRTARMVYSSCVSDDCLSRKGALLAVVRLPDGQLINLVGTHLNARGEDSVRSAQLLQLHAFIEAQAEKNVPLFISGDFNFDSASKSYSLALDKLGVTDAWISTHGSSEPGITYDTQNNRYAHDYSIQHGFPLTQERIDYVLTRSSDYQAIRVLDTRIIFQTEPLLSDHYGLYGRFELNPR